MRCSINDDDGLVTRSGGKRIHFLGQIWQSRHVMERVGVEMDWRELAKETEMFREVDPKQSRAMLFRALAVMLLLLAVAASPVPRLLAYGASVLAGLVNVRLFIFYHDCLHGALFARAPGLRRLMRVYGYLTLTPPRIWRDSHNYHHAHTAKIVGSSVGSFPVLTTRMYQRATRLQRFFYRAVRSPLNMLCGYFTIFILGMCLLPFARQPKRYQEGLISVLLHVAGVAAVTWFFGFEIAFRVLMLPLMVSCSMGAYLFYVQHNFPGMQIRGRETWDFGHAALHSSSMMTTGRLMGWFTGNIGYHHVHHLNPHVPFYRLPEAMANIPGLQNPSVSSLAPKDVLAALRLDVWDMQSQRMISFKEMRKTRAASTQQTVSA